MFNVNDCTQLLACVHLERFVKTHGVESVLTEVGSILLKHEVFVLIELNVEHVRHLVDVELHFRDA